MTPDGGRLVRRRRGHHDTVRHRRDERRAQLREARPVWRETDVIRLRQRRNLALVRVAAATEDVRLQVVDAAAFEDVTAAVQRALTLAPRDGNACAPGDK